jgi:uncharacterized membrane protein HdeD (DUF308 family)
VKFANFKLGGVLLIVAGVAFIASSIMGSRSVFLVLGCSFIAIGGCFIAVSRKQGSA